VGEWVQRNFYFQLLLFALLMTPHVKGSNSGAKGTFPGSLGAGVPPHQAT
jgi:hypothetical protein